MKKLILMFMVVMATIFTVSCGDDGNDSNNPNESGGIGDFLNAVKGFTDTVGGEEITFSADGKTMTVKDGTDTVIYTFDWDTTHNTQGVYKGTSAGSGTPHYVAMYIKNGKEMYILDAVADGILDKNAIDWSGPATKVYTLP